MNVHSVNLMEIVYVKSSKTNMRRTIKILVAWVICRQKGAIRNESKWDVLQGNTRVPPTQ